MSQHPFRPARRRTSIAAAAAVVALLGSLAACGGGSSDATSADGTTKVTFLRSTGSTFEAVYIAKEQGFFKDAGLDVTIKEGAADTSQNAPSVVNGEAQFAQTDSSGFVKAASQNLPVKVVSNLQASDTSVDPSDGLVVTKDSGITSFKDVEGKTIALPALGGTLQFITEYSAEQAGVDPSKIKFVALPLPSIVAAVKSGKVDGAYLFATFLDGARSEGLTVIGEGTNALPGLPQALVFGSSSYLEKNPDVAKKFVEALGKGIDYANANQEDVRTVDAKYTQMDPAYIKARSIQPFTAEVDVDALTAVVDGMKDYGLIESKPKIADFLWSGLPTVSQ